MRVESSVTVSWQNIMKWMNLLSAIGSCYTGIMERMRLISPIQTIQQPLN